MKPGTVVRATILARVLGVKLLTVEARVVLDPEDVLEEPRRRALPRFPDAASLPIGTGLLEASRTLDQART